MKAAVFYEPNDLRVEDVSEPDIADDEVLVEVAACGFCGSDVEYYYGKSPVGTSDGKGPLVLGHEFSGRIAGLGKLAGSYGLAEGDRVAVNPIQSCNACMSCRAGKPQFCANLSVLGVTTNGGFATYAKTKAAHAYKLPDSLTDEQGAFVEMLAAAVNAVRKAEVQPGDFVVVYGPGPVGLSMVQLLKNEGRGSPWWAPATTGSSSRNSSGQTSRSRPPTARSPSRLRGRTTGPSPTRPSSPPARWTRIRRRSP